MKNIIIICFAGEKTNGCLSAEELLSLKNISHKIKKDFREKTTIYCGNNVEEDGVLTETIKILNPESNFFIVRKIDFLSRRNSKRSASNQSFFVNDHLKKVYFSQKNIPPEIVLMSEPGIKKLLSHLTDKPGYSCPEDFLKKEISVGVVLKIKIPQKQIEGIS